MRFRLILVVMFTAMMVACQETDVTVNLPSGPTPPDTVINQPPPPPPPVSKPATIKVSPDSTGIVIPATFTFAGVATGKDGKPTTITWSTLSPSIATVDPKTGLVTGVNPGMARIVGTNDADPTVKDTVKIMVTQQVQSISISPTSYIGAVGGVMDFTVTVVPSTYTFTCKSSMATVATFNLVTVGGVKKCRAQFFALSPQNGVSPVQLYAVTDQAHTFPNGTTAQLEAGAQVRVTATGK